MSWQRRHRGPYRLLVTRHTAGKPHVRAEWLPGRVGTEDVEEEARTLLGDPRDSIVSVDVWSVQEEQFVMTYRKEAA